MDISKEIKRLDNFSFSKDSNKEHHIIEYEIENFMQLIKDNIKDSLKDLNEVVNKYNELGFDIVHLVLYTCLFYNNYHDYQGIGGYHFDILNKIKDLDGFDVNRYYTFQKDSRVYHYHGKDGLTIQFDKVGYPLYMKATTPKLFEWCLKNGADLSLKIKVIDEIEYLKKYESDKDDKLEYSTHFRGIKKAVDGLTCKEYLCKNKKKTYIVKYNDIVKENVSDGFKINDFDGILSAMVADNKEVLVSLENYRHIIANQSVRGKNLLMYAIDKNCYDWAKVLIEGNYVNQDDVNSYNQSGLLYAINRKRPYMIKLLIDNKFLSNNDLVNGNDVFEAALSHYPKLASKIEVHKILPIFIDKLDKNHFGVFHQVYNTDRYKQYVLKELSVFESSMMMIDLADLGIVQKPSTNKKLRV